ncbi:nuclear transcription factor Y subunit C-1-like [Lycium ferocissimum]|uniref:nuclear transcription factor Y subunit C-1-like n=1 Tax=Lycium ferocissimum TaxID=112874 RepID=UPI0028154100|nr:nuclear transcription factor Y subunit C-1-like [Lycium ferocissimum]
MENKLHLSAANKAAAQSSGYPQPPYDHLLEKQQEQVEMCWNFQYQEIENLNDFKDHHLPLARFKRITKADGDVHMISAEAPIVFAKACELFILELTIRFWLHAEGEERRTLHKSNLEAAITLDDIFNFLVDVIPTEAAAGNVGSTSSGGPYYYSPLEQPDMPGVHPSMYLQPPPPPSQALLSIWHPAGDATGQSKCDDQSVNC